jgi:putative protease
MDMSEKEVARVTHYFSRLSVAVLSLTGALNVGDRIHLYGHNTDFEQTVDSMQIEHKPVLKVGPGDDVALKVQERVREGDIVYRIA